MAEHWIVQYGTMTTVVAAEDADTAFARFVDKLAFNATGVRPVPRAGRIVPPTRDEVTIRRPTERDRGWIEDSDNPAFVALLAELDAKQEA